MALLVALLAIGFFFHTSPGATILGKYHLKYAVFLGVLYLVLTPGVFFFTRFLLSSHEIVLSSGRRIPVRPRLKLYVLLVMVLVGYIVVNSVVQRQLARRTFTHNPHVFHPYLQNTPRPNHQGLHINRWGFRGEEIEKVKPEGTFRVFVFGGSTVFCGTVPFEDSHCRVLEKELRAASPERRIEVQNLGAEWHCSEHSVIKLLFRAPEFSPDLAVICHGINDLVRGFSADAFCEGEYQSDYGHYLGAVINLVRPSDTARLLLRTSRGHWFSDFRFDQVRVLGPEGKGLSGSTVLFFPKARPVTIEQWRSLPAFERNLRDFVQIAKSKNIPVVMTTQPSLYRDDLSPAEREVILFPLAHEFQGQYASTASMTRGMELFNGKTRQVARDFDVPLVDLEAAVPKTLEYLYDDVHYTKKGNELIGKTMARQIIKAGLIGGN